MGQVDWSRDAEEDLHRIPDASVCAEIMDLAEGELTRLPSTSPIEGLVEKYHDLWWRRAVRRSDVGEFMKFVIDDDDEFHNQAWNYVIVYRLITEDERILFRRAAIRDIFARRADRYVVLRVLHNREFAMRFPVG